MHYFKYTLPVLTLMAALALSSVAAYYSILGLTIIFAGGLIGFILMEVAKVVATLYLHKHWNDGIGLIKYGLTVSVLTLMLITSMGTFGFYSRASLGKSEHVTVNSSQVEYLEQSIQRNKSTMDMNLKQIEQYNQSISRLITDNPTKASRERRNLQNQINQLTQENREISKEITKLNTELIPFKTEIKKNDVEIGPLLYISKMVYGEQYREYSEKVLSWLIVIIVLVFDPVAIMLLIASQQSFAIIRRNNKMEDKGVEKEVYEVSEDEPVKVEQEPEPEPEPELTEMQRQIKAKRERMSNKKHQM